MSELDDIQRFMVQMLRSRRALPADASVEHAARARFRGNGRLSAVAQLEIYREQFWLRHTASLLEDFPALSAIVGQEAWERLVEGYLSQHPPDSWTLRDLGRLLPDHVAKESWLPHRALCADMARLEWAYVDVFDAAEAQPIDPAPLSKVPEDAWEIASFTLTPALRLIATQFPVAELKGELARRDAEKPVPSLPGPSSRAYAVHRGKALDVRFVTLEPAEFALLRALGEKLPLNAAFHRAIECHPASGERIAAKIGEWFHAWGKLGFITGVTVP